MCASILLAAFAQSALGERGAPQRLGKDATHQVPERSDEPREATSEAVAKAMAQDSFSHLSMLVSDDGKMEIAGVVHYEYTPHGLVLVEARMDGDFDLDPVLILNVPVEVDDDGVLVTTAVQRISRNDQNIVLTLNSGGAGGIAVEVNCYVSIPIGGGDKKCVNNGCPLSKPLCSWVIDDNDPNAVTCDCIVDPGQIH